MSATKIFAYSLLFDVCAGLSNDVWTMPWTPYRRFAHSGTIVPVANKVDVSRVRGSALYVVSDNTNHKVYTTYTNTDSKVANDFDAGAQLSTPDSATAGFGASIALGWKEETGNMLLVGQVDSGTLNVGVVHYYSGEYSAWSVQQTLRPPREFYEQSHFGAAIDLDDLYQRDLVVGCKGCNVTRFESGALYLYEPQSPSTKKWTQTGVLSTTPNMFLLGSTDVQINGDIIVADVQDRDSNAAGSPVKNAVVFQRKGPHQWTQLQQVHIGSAAVQSVTDLTVYDETIIIGAADASYLTYTTAGTVSVLYPSTERYHLQGKGKPQPVQWSVQQVLVSPVVTTGLRFGDSVSLQGNRLAISDGGATSKRFYLYRREELHGRWSLQQTIQTNPVGIVTDLKLVKNSLAVIENTNTTPGLQVWDETRNWDCLLISLEDHFNDGWDGATLEIETPSGEKDIFTSRCDTNNPYQFRYCPTGEEDTGLYKFRIRNAKQAKFFWEMIWRVYQEKDGDWITGNWDTEVDFYWSKSTRSFSYRRLDKALPNNITCEHCANRPTASPTKAPSSSLRHLSSKDSTHAPTISPAPTIITSISLVPWQEVRLITSGTSAWFDAQHKGTSYYISDKHGHRLLSTGTMCPDERTLAYKKCWEELPDGEYIFRVGGALDRFSTSHTFKFCSSKNELKQESQMIFRVSHNGGHCEILSYATSTTHCKNKAGLVQFVGLTMDIMGTFSVTSLSQEHSALSNAISTAYPFVRPSDVRLISSTSRSEGELTVQLLLSVGSLNSGFDFMDVDSLDSFLEAMTGDLGARQVPPSNAF